MYKTSCANGIVVVMTRTLSRRICIYNNTMYRISTSRGVYAFIPTRRHDKLFDYSTSHIVVMTCVLLRETCLLTSHISVDIIFGRVVTESSNVHTKRTVAAIAWTLTSHGTCLTGSKTDALKTCWAWAWKAPPTSTTPFTVRWSSIPFSKWKTTRTT